MAGLAKGPLSPFRMESCISGPQQELLVAFEEQNLRYVSTVTSLINDTMCAFQGFY